MLLRTAVALLLFGVSVAWADENASTKRFATDAAGAGMAEVELGKLAVQKAENPAVKAFAETMVKDHTQANAELGAIATADGVSLPATLPPAEKTVADTLGHQAGSAFDRAYVAQMVKDHEKAVALFTAAASSNDVDSDFREFAQKTLPTLQHHLKEAQALNSQLSAPAKQSAR